MRKYEFIFIDITLTKKILSFDGRTSGSILQDLFSNMKTQRSTFSLLDLPEAEKPAEAFAECEFSPQITATASPLLPIQLPSSGLYEGTFDHLLLFPILLTKTQITVDPLSLSLGSSLTLLTDQGVDLKKLPKSFYRVMHAS